MRDLHVLRRGRHSRFAAATVAALFAGGVAATGIFGAAQADEPEDRQAEFTSAAVEFGVPESVLLGVSYLESRWIDHDGQYSTSGGFGLMHLTDAEYAIADSAGSHHDGEDARGDESRPMEADAGEIVVPEGEAYSTLPAAADLLGVDAEQLRADPAQNIRGGAALLASYADELNIDSTSAADWYPVVARYAGSDTQEAAAQFADQVYAQINTGATETTDDGVVSLPPQLVVPNQDSLAAAGLPEAAKGKTDCPKKLRCEWIPAPYEQYGDGPGDYGNHDLANRPKDMDIDYIVIHDTEGSYETTLRLVQDPTYVSWQYTLRSSDGHIAQHIRPDEVAWQAGNWNINSHSIGLEHEGYAASGAWYTEAMYRSSATLVRYLADRFDVPLDRAHIIGHDNVPGLTTSRIRQMHWDPGPFWDWEHYFKLLHAKVKPGDSDSGLVAVAPKFDSNLQEFTGCDSNNPSASCGQRSASTVFLHSEPNAESPLLVDIGLRPDGSPSTKQVSDGGSRAGYGQTFAVAEVSGDWTAVWYLGQKGWIHNPADAPVLVPVDGQKVVPLNDDTPVYGGVYPEEAAYEDTGVPYQKMEELPYRLDTDQAYSFAGEYESQYYWAKTFDGPNILVEGDRTFYQIQLGGRTYFVNAEDAELV